MPEIISVGIAMIAVAAAPRRNLAMSSEGEFTHTQVTAVWDRFESSFSLQAHGDTLAELDMLAIEHADEGWDGDAAPGVTFETVTNARTFITLLPDGVPAPELAVDPDDGSISLEWGGGYRRAFSVSIGDGDRLACAGINGTDRWHAAVHFDGASIPELVLQGIQTVS